MQVVSTNLGEKKTVNWKGKKVETGIYKQPVEGAIYLGAYGVQKDQVVDLKVHGGIDKSCYLYSEDHYSYWKEVYSQLGWNWGMFGENLTVSGLDESKIYIGDIYEVGDAHIQVSQPRQPCYKLGIRFGDQKILKDFIKSGFSGAYVRVIKEGLVKKGDTLKLIIRSRSGLPVSEIFRMLYDKRTDRDQIENAIYDGNLSNSVKRELAGKLNRIT